MRVVEIQGGWQIPSVGFSYMLPEEIYSMYLLPDCLFTYQLALLLKSCYQHKLISGYHTQLVEVSDRSYWSSTCVLQYT